ncbi:hypothetical protein F511_10683 [Dorcoceras hygrometricum]|uniref:Uncharacterized protein n=1 Tax=Dorcoceras hygrometricum TaxID=472368 RepID=A0A2Z7CH72_9LAMI|nr:hypothetical protein F511_10683 [Dorcoceras hygrometricum]
MVQGQSSSSSSSSEAQNGAGGPYLVILCERCGGKHRNAQCSGVQGYYNHCGQQGHYARYVGPEYKYRCDRHSFLMLEAGRAEFPQSFPGPQHAHVYTLTEDQAREAPGNVIAVTCSIYDHAAHVLFDTATSHYVDEYDLVITPFYETISVSMSCFII